MKKTITPGQYSYDLCIIGAGPAGLALASEFAYSGLKICVLESGGDKRTQTGDSLKEVISPELPIKNNSRERVVGGATSTWGGLSATLDVIDFSAREWSAGWPITPSELAPYMERSIRYKFPPLKMFDSHSLEGEWGNLKNLENKTFVAVRPPFDFSSLKNIFNRPHQDLFTQATVVKIEADNGSVTRVLCRTTLGEAVEVKARVFILACGGIENVRLLLVSNIGNEYDQVGRYFMNHPKGYAGVLKLNKPLSPGVSYLPQTIKGCLVYMGLHLTETFQRDHDLLNSCVQFELRLNVLQRLFFALWKRVSNLLPGGLPKIHPRRLNLRWFADMEPRAENRITLSERKDDYGVPLPVVQYRLGERDKKTLAALYQEIERNVETSNLGKLSGTLQEMMNSVRDDASHHLGGTIMGMDPHRSVVDHNSKVHSLRNLYITGSSIFPTAGCANPTFTIVALALRLADHLKNEFGISHESEVKEEKLPGDKVVIVGAGNRVIKDVLPTIESLSGTLQIKGIFARHIFTIFGGKKPYDVRPLTELSTQFLSDVRFIYIAVPREVLSEVISALPPPHPEAELIIETPAIFSHRTLSLLKRYKRVHIAEDSVFLPWLPLLKGISLRYVQCLQSVYRYHGIALLKTLSGGPVRYGFRIGNTLWFKTGSLAATVIEPRDYTKGRLLFDGKEIKLEHFKDRCVGFRLGNKYETITEAESELVGTILETDTIVTKMGELKCIGLRRLLLAAHKGSSTWSLEEAIDDSLVDTQVHRYRMYLRLV